MKRHTIPVIMSVLTLAIIVLPASVFGQSTGVAGAGAGSLPAGASLNGVSLSGLKFGMGVIIPGDGTADGEFQATLLGTTLLGLVQNIQVGGTATAGSLGTGSRTFSGIATLDMGNGTLPTSVPFTVTATATSLLLVLSTTNLPSATLTAGSIAIK